MTLNARNPGIDYASLREAIATALDDLEKAEASAADVAAVLISLGFELSVAVIGTARTMEYTLELVKNVAEISPEAWATVKAGAAIPSVKGSA
ncbi:hypothetical protein [Paradevosia shaoguanensis]|uniref:hypothetical protein n=1 Tax=Paradevosia shaoguanensis TaxID=1335043 RepID=UPI00193143A7|nr:hypothetical protein [Paradevosia shaoguanensis]